MLNYKVLFNETQPFYSLIVFIVRSSGFTFNWHLLIFCHFKLALQATKARKFKCYNI